MAFLDSGHVCAVLFFACTREVAAVANCGGCCLQRASSCRSGHLNNRVPPPPGHRLGSEGVRIPVRHSHAAMLTTCLSPTAKHKDCDGREDAITAMRRARYLSESAPARTPRCPGGVGAYVSTRGISTARRRAHVHVVVTVVTGLATIRGLRARAPFLRAQRCSSSSGLAGCELARAGGLVMGTFHFLFLGLTADVPMPLLCKRLFVFLPRLAVRPLRLHCASCVRLSQFVCVCVCFLRVHSAAARAQVPERWLL